MVVIELGKVRFAKAALPNAYSPSEYTELPSVSDVSGAFQKA